MKPWKRVEPTIEQKIGWRTVVTKTFILPNGVQNDYQLVGKENSHNAGIIAITKDNQAIVAREFRPGPEKIMDEIPGGGVNNNETDYQQAAVRELKEETGYVPGKITYLGSIYKDAYTNSSWHYYLAEDCEYHPDGQSLDDHEFIEVRQISIQQLIENAKKGHMTDTEAVFLAHDILKTKMESK